MSTSRAILQAYLGTNSEERSSTARYGVRDPQQITYDREQNKIVVMDSTDSEYGEAIGRRGVLGALLIISHGNEESAGKMSPRQWARLIQDSGMHSEGMLVVHDACNIAKSEYGFAQQMANILNSPYRGPNAYSVTFLGLVSIGIWNVGVGGNPDFTSPGYFKTFYPNQPAAALPETNPRDRR